MRLPEKIIFSILSIFLLAFSGLIASSDALAHSEVMTQVPVTVHPFTLRSPEFADGAPLSKHNEYAGSGCYGDNVAPTLIWHNPPVQTKSFALVMNDLDAAVSGGFHHWIVYNVPPTVRALRGNAPYTEGTTSLGTHAYFGPCPPATGQLHHYAFTLYALDLEQIGEQGLSYDNLIQTLNGHVVGATTIVGTFQRISPPSSRRQGD